jgi:hypothetical protein
MRNVITLSSVIIGSFYTDIALCIFLTKTEKRNQVVIFLY